MTKNAKPISGTAETPALPTKHQQVVDLLKRDAGASLEELSNLAHWLPHSTRAFLTGLKKKGYTIASDKTDGVRRYRATKTPLEGAAK